MRSQDRTLLANLGFADPDKKDSLHDVACRYLCQPDVAQKMAELFAPVPRTQRNQFDETAREKETGCVHPTTVHEVISYSVGKIVKARTEAPISKGEGQYKTTIGFADVVIAYELLMRRTGERHINDGRIIPLEADGGRIKTPWIGIEVKINPVSTSEVIRQINLYREYRPETTWAAVLAFDISSSELTQLQQAGIGHAKLGQSFIDYAAKETSSNRQIAEAVEI